LVGQIGNKKTTELSNLFEVNNQRTFICEQICDLKIDTSDITPDKIVQEICGL